MLRNKHTIQIYYFKAEEVGESAAASQDERKHSQVSFNQVANHLSGQVSPVLNLLGIKLDNQDKVPIQESSTQKISQGFQDLGKNIQQGMLRVPEKVAQYIFLANVGFSADTAPSVDVQDNQIVAGNTSEIEKYTQLKFNKSVYHLKGEGILVTLPDGCIAVNTALLQQKIAQRTLGVEYVKMLKTVGLWEMIKSNSKDNVEALTLLGTLEAEAKNYGSNIEQKRTSPVEHINLIEVENSDSYMFLEEYQDSLKTRFTQPNFSIPLEEVSKLAKEAGVDFEINYRPESHAMESALATNTHPEYDDKENRLKITIRDTMSKDNRSFLNFVANNEDTEALLSIKNVLQKIKLRRQENPSLVPNTSEFEAMVNEVLANEDMSGSPSFQLYTLSRDYVTSAINQRFEHNFRQLSGQGNLENLLMDYFPEIQSTVKAGKVESFKKLPQAQQEQILQGAKAHPELQKYPPEQIAKIVDAYIETQKKLPEIKSYLEKFVDEATLENIIQGKIQKFTQLPKDSQTQAIRGLQLKDPEYYAQKLNEELAKSFQQLGDPTTGLYNSYSSASTNRPDIDWQDPVAAENFLSEANAIADYDRRPVVYYQNPDWTPDSALPPFLARAKTPEELQNQPLAWKLYDQVFEAKRKVGKVFSGE